MTDDALTRVAWVCDCGRWFKAVVDVSPGGSSIRFELYHGDDMIGRNSYVAYVSQDVVVKDVLKGVKRWHAAYTACGYKLKLATWEVETW